MTAAGLPTSAPARLTSAYARPRQKTASIAPPIPTICGGSPLPTTLAFPVRGLMRTSVPSLPLVTYSAPSGPTVLPLPKPPSAVELITVTVGDAAIVVAPTVAVGSTVVAVTRAASAIVCRTFICLPLLFCPFIPLCQRRTEIHRDGLAEHPSVRPSRVERSRLRRHRRRGVETAHHESPVAQALAQIAPPSVVRTSCVVAICSSLQLLTVLGLPPTTCVTLLSLGKDRAWHAHI